MYISIYIYIHIHGYIYIYIHIHGYEVCTDIYYIYSVKVEYFFYRPLILEANAFRHNGSQVVGPKKCSLMLEGFQHLFAD